jgi:hypothetical protein
MGSIGYIEQTMTVALSNEQDSLIAGTSILTIRSPFDLNLSRIPRAYVTTVSSSGLPTIDIKLNGTSILDATNKLTIDVSQKSSKTATTPTSLVTSSMADDDEITFDVTTAGTGTKGLKVTLYFWRAPLITPI